MCTPNPGQTRKWVVFYAKRASERKLSDGARAQGELTPDGRPRERLAWPAAMPSASVRRKAQEAQSRLRPPVWAPGFGPFEKAADPSIYRHSEESIGRFKGERRWVQNLTCRAACEGASTPKRLMMLQAQPRKIGHSS